VIQAKFPALPSNAVFDIVLANVYFTFFRMESQALGRVMTPGSVLLASGLREEEGASLIDELRPASITARIIDECDGWIVMRGVKE
jgi:hypothetical protein